MIKEIGYTVDDKGYAKCGPMDLVDEIDDPWDRNIPIPIWTEYFKDELDRLGIIKVKRRGKFKNGDRLYFLTSYPFMCVSKEFKDVFEGKLKGYWYPTTDKNYFVFLLDNYIDPFDRTKTFIQYEAGNPHNPWCYRYMKNVTFKKEVEKNEYLFAIPEDFNSLFCTPKFEKLLDEHGLTGFQVYKKMRFLNEDFKSFDSNRSKKYDKEGNAI